MAKTIENYLSDLENKQDAWHSRVVDPYAKAYKRAHMEYEKNVKADSDAAKARAELAVMVLSMGFGGLLTSAFAGVALKKVIADKVIATATAKNMTRAKKALETVQNSKGLSFIAGSAYDEISKKISEGTKKQLSDAIMQDLTFVANFRRSPLEIYLSLDQFLRELKVRAYDIGAAVRDSDMTLAQKSAAAEKLSQAPLFKPPTAPLNEAQVQKDIELALYMTLVLDQDYFEKSTGFGGPYYGKVDTTTAPIPQMPSAKNYPQSYNRNVSKVNGYSASVTIDIGTVKYKSLGKNVTKRIKQLAPQFFQGSLDRGELVKAEQILTSMSNKNLGALSGATAK